MNRRWYEKVRAAARRRSDDMYSAWHAAKGKPGDSATHGKRITAQESFFQGFQDAKSGHRDSSGSFSNPGMTFRSLPVGARFEFESKRTMPFSGMMRGPWVKTGTRGYRTDPDNGLKYRVGSINVKVDRLDAGNPRVKLPANWTPAQIRVLPGGDVQIGLSQNPLSAKGGRFAKCVKAVEAKGGAYDPRAVCGAMEKPRKGNGRSFVRRGESVPRHYQPKAGEVWYLEGRKAVIKRVGESDGVPYVFFQRPVDGTLAMSVANLIQAARLERSPSQNPGKHKRAERKRFGHSLRSAGVKKFHGPRTLARYIRQTESSIARGKSMKSPSAQKRTNPGAMRTFQVDVPQTRYDKGYRLTIKAKTKASARAEAKRYCANSFAKYTGRPASQYKLPSKTKVREI